MREIKYRAYHKGIGKTFRVALIGFHSGGGHTITSGEDFGALVDGQNNGRYTCDANDAELMQFTGLKDRHGVEIYEGDIFHLDEDMTPAVIEYTNSLDGTSANSAEFCFSLYEYGKCFQQLSLDEFYINRCEVIGNIYENPELLEVAA